MKLQLKTLSPLHIGNGEKHNGLSYIVNRGKVLFYDSDKVMENLTPKYSEKFMQWIERITSEIEQLEKQKRSERNEQRKRDIIQKLRYAQRKLSLKELVENTISVINIKNNFYHNCIYAIEAKSQVYNNVDIECFIKQNNKPYIPGTEIKGAIRTAVLSYLVNKDENWAWLKDKLYKFRKRFNNELQRIPGQKGIQVSEYKKKLVKEMSKINEELQIRHLRANNHTDAKYDLLKMLYIGDTNLNEPSQCLFVSDIETKNIIRNFRVFQELCKKGQIFTCQGFKLDNNKIVLDKLGFSPDQIRIVSDIKNLFQCCYEFSSKLLDEELAYRHFSTYVKDKLKAIKAENKPDSPVIRIGKNEGYLSLTLGLLVKERDKDLYDKVLCHATKNTSYTGNYPKTRKVVNLGNGDQDTCGWVKLIIENDYSTFHMT